MVGRLLVRTLQFFAALLIALTVLFAVQAWHVRNSDFIVNAQRSAKAYSCIGDNLFQPPVKEYPAAILAMRYRFASEPNRGFSIRQRLSEASAAFALDLMYSDAELNRMHASLTLGPFSSFDDMSLRLFDTTYCKLSDKRRALVTRFERSSYFPRFRKFLLAYGESDAEVRLRAFWKPSPE